MLFERTKTVPPTAVVNVMSSPATIAPPLAKAAPFVAVIFASISLKAKADAITDASKILVISVIVTTSAQLW